MSVCTFWAPVETWRCNMDGSVEEDQFFMLHLHTDDHNVYNIQLFILFTYVCMSSCIFADMTFKSPCVGSIKFVILRVLRYIRLKKSNSYWTYIFSSSDLYSAWNCDSTFSCYIWMLLLLFSFVLLSWVIHYSEWRIFPFQWLLRRNRHDGIIGLAWLKFWDVSFNMEMCGAELPLELKRVFLLMKEWPLQSCCWYITCISVTWW